MLMTANRHIGTIGAYRTHEDPMQIVSAVWTIRPPAMKPYHQGRSRRKWRPTPGGSTNRRQTVNSPCPLSLVLAWAICISKASIRLKVGMAGLAEHSRKKSLAQTIGQPRLIALAYTIEHGRKAYYDQLERHQRTLDITEWLVYFAGTIPKAQQTTLMRGGRLYQQGAIL